MEDGTLEGTVSDEPGEPLPGVVVTARNDNSQRATVTNEVGRFIFRDLAPGEYFVTASMPGFNTLQEEATVRLGQSTTLEMTLQVSSIQES